MSAREVSLGQQSGGGRVLLCEFWALSDRPAVLTEDPICFITRSHQLTGVEPLRTLKTFNPPRNNDTLTDMNPVSHEHFRKLGYFLYVVPVAAEQDHL